MLSLSGAGIALSCASVGTGQTADLVGKGRYQLAAGVGYQGSPGFKPPNGLASSAVRGDLAVRRGVTDDLDLGGRVGFLFATQPSTETTSMIPEFELMAKFRRKPLAGRIPNSLVPSIGFSEHSYGSPIAGGEPIGWSINFSLPWLIGIPVGTNHQLVFGPKIQNRIEILHLGPVGFFTGEGTGPFHVVSGGTLGGDQGLTGYFGPVSGNATFDVLSAGSSIGFCFFVNRDLKLLPEVAFGYPLLIIGPTTTSTGYAIAGMRSVTFQFSLTALHDAL